MGALSKLLATGFGIGYLPWAPGTWGSLAAVLVLTLVYRLAGDVSSVLHACLTVLLFPLAWVTSGSMARRLSDRDPSVVVVDEMFGQFLTLLWIPVTPLSWGLGFAVFRLFDILKPFPARHSEQLPGGLGIVADDLVAGCYAGFFLLLVYAC